MLYIGYIVELNGGYLAWEIYLLGWQVFVQTFQNQKYYTFKAHYHCGINGEIIKLYITQKWFYGEIFYMIRAVHLGGYRTMDVSLIYAKIEKVLGKTKHGRNVTM